MNHKPHQLHFEKMDLTDLQNQLHYLLQHLTFKTDYNLLVLLFKLIAQTRDIITGKGEYNLAFMQLTIWHQYYPILAMKAFKLFVNYSNNTFDFTICNYTCLFSWCSRKR